MGLKEILFKRWIHQQVPEGLIQPREPRQLGVPGRPLHEEAVPVVYQELDGAPQGFQQYLRPINYQGLPKERELTVFEKMFRFKDQRQYLEERWEALTVAFNDAVEMIYSPVYPRKEYAEQLKQNIDDMYEAYKSERGAIKDQLGDEATFTDIKEAVKALKISEEKRVELESLCQHYIDLFDEGNAFDSLYAEYEGRDIPFRLESDHVIYRDPAIVRHQLSYAHRGGNNAFARQFLEHSNQSLLRLETDLIVYIGKILSDLRDVNRAQRPYEVTRKLLPESHEVTDAYLNKRAILRERRACLAYHQHILYSLMYERLNLFLNNMDNDLFSIFYRKVKQYISDQIQAYPEIDAIVEDNSEAIGSYAVTQLARTLGQQGGDEEEYERLPEQVIADGYTKIIEAYNLNAEEPLTDFAIDWDGYEASSAFVPVPDQAGVKIYFDSCRQAVDAVEFQHQLKGLTFDERNERITELCKDICDQMEANADYGIDFVTALCDDYLPQFSKQGEYISASRLFLQMNRDQPWLSMSEKQYYLNLGAAAYFNQYDETGLSELYELQMRFNYRFSKQQLFSDLAHLFERDVDDALQRRINHYLETLLTLDAMEGILNDAEKQGIALLNRVMSGDLTEGDLSEPIYHAHQLKGFAAFERLGDLFPQNMNGQLGKRFHDYVIERYVGTILTQELEATLDAVRGGEWDNEQIQRMQHYFRLYKAYYPNDEALVMKYMQKLVKAKGYFQGLFSCEIGLERDISEEHVQKAIELNCQYLHIFDGRSHFLKEQVSDYLDRFRGNNTTYFYLVDFLKVPYEGAEGGKYVDSVFVYAEKIIDFLLRSNGLQQIKFDDPNDSFMTFLDCITDHDQYPRIAQLFQKKLADYIVDGGNPWGDQGQRFVDRYGDPINKAEYRMKGFNHYVQLDRENLTEKYINYLKEQNISADNFFVNASQMRRLEAIVDDVLPNKLQFDKASAIKKLSELTLQKLVDSYLPSRQIKVRLWRLNLLITLCSYCSMNDDAGVYPVVKHFIQYFTQDKAHYDGIVLQRGNFTHAELMGYTADQMDGCFIPDDQHPLGDLPENQRQLFLQERSRLYMQQCINKMNGLFSAAIDKAEGAQIWSSHILRLMIHFGMRQDIENYFLQGVRLTLNKKDYQVAVDWKNRMIDVGIFDDSMKKMFKVWQSAADKIVRVFIEEQGSSASTLVVIDVCDLQARRQQFYLTRLCEFFRGDADNFYQEEHYDELHIYMKAFGVEPAIEDRESIHQQLQYLLGTHQLDTVDDLVEAVEAYLGTDMENHYANQLLGQIGLIRFLPKRLHDIFVIKRGKEEALETFSLLIKSQQIERCAELYQEFHQQLDDAREKHPAIVKACEKLIADAESLFLEEMARTAILNQILLRAKNIDGYLLEAFEQDCRLSVRQEIEREKYELFLERVDEEFSAALQPVNEQFLRDHYVGLASSPLVNNLQKKLKKNPSRADIDSALCGAYKKKSSDEAKSAAHIVQRKKVKNPDVYEANLLDSNKRAIQKKFAQAKLLSMLKSKVIELCNDELPGQRVVTYETAVEKLNRSKGLSRQEALQFVYAQMEFPGPEDCTQAYNDPHSHLYDQLRTYFADCYWQRQKHQFPITDEDIAERLQAHQQQACLTQTRGAFQKKFQKVLLTKYTNYLNRIALAADELPGFSGDGMTRLIFWQRLGANAQQTPLEVAVEFEDCLKLNYYPSDFWSEQFNLLNFHKLSEHFKIVLGIHALFDEYTDCPQCDSHPLFGDRTLRGIRFKDPEQLIHSSTPPASARKKSKPLGGSVPGQRSLPKSVPQKAKASWGLGQKVKKRKTVFLSSPLVKEDSGEQKEPAIPSFN